MAGVNVKMGVDVSQFKQGIQEASSSVKTLDAALKMNEKQLKATGDAELYMANKSKLLNQQMESQKKVVSNIQKQMAQMRESGVDQTSEAYQKLERALYNAAGKMMDIQTELNGLANSEQKAADGASLVATNVASINKKVSFDAVIKGIDSITKGMEKAAKIAVNLGKGIWDNITDSAEWADNTATMAAKLGMDVEDYQRYQKVFDTVADITVKDWQNAKNKVQRAIYSGSGDQMDALAALGIGIREGGKVSQNNYTSLKVREWEDVFWEIGDKLREKVASHQMTEDQADVYAQALFGRGYADLKPIFDLGREGFTEALEEQNVVSEESVNKLAELNDELLKLKGDFRDLQSEVLAGLAPALKSAAEVLDSLLTKLMAYLQSPEGQAALEKMGDAVSQMFSKLGEIDPEQVVSGVVEVFEKITGAFTWISDHWEAVVTGIEAIAGVFTTLKLAEGGLKVLELINGLKGLGGASGVEQAVNAANGGTAAKGGGLLGWIKGLGAKAAEGFAMNGLWGAAPLAVLAAGILPGLLAQSEATDRMREEQTAMEQNAARLAEENSENAKIVNVTAENSYLVKDENGNEKKNIIGQSYSEQSDDVIAALMGLQDRQGAERAKLQWMLGGAVNPMTGNYAWTDLESLWRGELEAGAIPELAKAVSGALSSKGMEDLWAWQRGSGFVYNEDAGEESADEISAAAGEISDAADKMGALPEEVAAAVSGVTLKVDLFGSIFGSHANGLWSVPWDGYPAILHKGERVVPAREAGANSYNSNLYVESMYMNNGQDAEGLAAAMAAAQRRTMSGYGS